MYKIPLSPYSNNLFLEWLIDKNRSDYNIVFDHIIEGDLNVLRLIKAIKRFISEHLIFNSHIEDEDGNLYWVQNTRIYELSHHDQFLKENEIKHFIKESFNLYSGPLYRFALIKLSEKTYNFIIVLHHIIIDASSFEILVDKISNYYNDENYQNDISLSKQKEFISIFSQKHSNYLLSNRDQIIDFWRQELSHIEKLTLSFLDRNDTKSIYDITDDIEEIRFSFDSEKLKKLQNIGSVSKYSFCQNVYAVLLYLYSKQNNFCISCPVKIKTEHNPLFYGSQINNLVTPFNFHTAKRIAEIFSESVKFVGRTKDGIIKHHLLPASHISTVSSADIFNISFANTNLKDKSFSFQSLRSYAKNSLNIDLIQDLLFEYEIRNDQINFRVRYKKSKISIHPLQNFVDEYERLFCFVLDNFDTSLELQDIERKLAIPKTLAKDQVSLDGNIISFRVMGLIRESAERRGDFVAVEDKKMCVTYGELWERSGVVAMTLRKKGVGLESRVCIYMDKSVEMVISILGVLRSGGAYVPVDMGYPRKRVEYILEHSGCSVLIRKGCGEGFNNFTGSVVDIDCLFESSKGEENALGDIFFCDGISGENLAYIMYTSGSSGLPKGVMGLHRNLDSSIMSRMVEYGVKNEKSLFIVSGAFDSSITAIFWPLVEGGCLSIEDGGVGVKELEERIWKEKVTHLASPVGVYLELLRDGWYERLESLRLVIVAGEQCPDEVSDLHYEKMKNTYLSNEYGPTEASVWSSYSLLYDPSTGTNSDLITIGKTRNGSKIFILDDDFELQKNGEIGEIYISGACIARGYLDNPSLTSERFIANPYSDKAGSGLLLYKTGDLAKCLSDGRICFIGRKDEQVKIRGYRIEIGEIEYLLNKHKSVIQSAVVVDNSGSTPILNAYTYVISSTGINRNKLKEYLRSSLPEYMVPSIYITHTKFPTNEHGKIDKNLLHKIRISPESFKEHLEVRTHTEKEVSMVFSELLSNYNIGIDEDLVNLGIHSIIAMKFISRVRWIYEIDLPFKDVFEKCTIRLISKSIESLIKSSNSKSLPRITRVKIYNEFPLSSSQQRLWFLDKLIPNKALYNVTLAFKLIGELCINRLLDSINLIISENQILRSRIFDIYGTPYQEPLHDYKINLEDFVIDLRNIDEQEKIRYANQFLDMEISRPFNLQVSCMMRTKILRMTDIESIFVINLHHIVCDDWTIRILLSEISKKYNEIETNNEERFQFSDYVLWKRDHLGEVVIAEQLKYWQKKLESYKGYISLPFSKKRPKELTYEAGNYSYNVGKELYLSARKKARELGVTLYVYLLSLFKLIIYKFSFSENVTVGSPFSIRYFRELEDVMGFLVESFPLSTNIDDSESFRDFVARVKNTVHDAQSNLYAPLEKLIDSLKIEREANNDKLFQFWFVLEEELPVNIFINFKNVKSERMKIPSKFSKFDLSLCIVEGDGMVINFEYSKDLFDEEDIARFAKIFVRLIEFEISSEEKVRDINIISQQEISERNSWNDRSKKMGDVLSLNELEKVWYAKADNIAVNSDNLNITYKIFQKKVGDASNYLVSIGVSRGTIVCIMLDYSVELVIWIFAILKAGGAYVPMDPNNPLYRNQFIIEDSNAKFLLTQRKFEKFSSLHSGRNIFVDGDFDSCPVHSHEYYPEDLAYIIYTSGTTGKPKGVMITRRNLSNYLAHALDQYGISGKNTVLHSSYSFDMSITSIFVPILSGGTVIVFRDRYDIEKLQKTIQLSHIGYIKLTPSHLRILSGIDRKIKIIVGGEKLLKNDLDDFADNEIINEYGPTETTVGCCTYSFLGRNVQENIPIGEPISNTEIYILDKNINIVAPLVVGEIYIGGNGIGLGYWNRPNITVERFIANPFKIPGDSRYKRIYKTGDLGRYKNGKIEYFGRADEQVKLRGYRVELEEIENTIREHGDVLNAAAVVREGNFGEKLVVLYIVPGKFGMTELEVVDFLGVRLPEYMLPSSVCIIDNIPLASSGKIRKDLLLDPKISTVDNYEEPRNEVEKQICSTLEEVLKIKPIGINDNFFKLGGDSIISLQLITKLKRENIHVRVLDIFRNPTVKMLSKLACNDENINTADQTTLSGFFPLMPAQKWFLTQNLKFQGHYNQYVVLDLKVRLEINLLRKIFNILVSHHDILRCKFARNDSGDWEQKCAEEIVKEICIECDLAVFTDYEERSKLEEDIIISQSNFTLESEPLIKAILINYEDSQRLLIVIHHMIVDGVSWNIILDDIASITSSVLDGKKPNLPRKTNSFSQWLEELQQFSKSELLGNEQNYWEETVKNSFERKNNVDFNTSSFGEAGYIEESLSEKETETLLRKIPTEFNVEINDILLTALTLAFGDWNRKYRISIFLEGHGRENISQELDLSRTVGWFTSIFPINLVIDDPSRIESSIRQIKYTMRKIPNKGIGFGVLSYLRKDVALPQSLNLVCFNYLGQLDIFADENNIFKIDKEFIKFTTHPDNKLIYPLDINASVKNRKFMVSFTYDKNCYNYDDVSSISKNFVTRLKIIIEESINTNGISLNLDLLDDKEISEIHSIIRGK